MTLSSLMPKFIYIEYTFNKTQTYDSIFYNILFQKEIEDKKNERTNH